MGSFSLLKARQKSEAGTKRILSLTLVVLSSLSASQGAASKTGDSRFESWLPRSTQLA